MSTIKKKNVIDSISQTFQLYEKKMYHIAYAVLQDPYQAEDAVMDAFVRLLEKGMSSAATETLKPLVRDPRSDETKRMMISLIRWAAIDIYRKNQRNRAREVMSSTVADLQPETGEERTLRSGKAAFEAEDDPAVILSKEEGVQELLQGLPPIYKDVLYERYQNERTVNETAKILSISEDAVRKRQERALRMLR